MQTIVVMAPDASITTLVCATSCQKSRAGELLQQVLDATNQPAQFNLERRRSAIHGRLWCSCSVYYASFWDG